MKRKYINTTITPINGSNINPVKQTNAIHN